MNIEKSLLITKDRIESLKGFTPSNESEARIAAETIEYLEFVEKMIEKEIGK